MIKILAKEVADKIAAGEVVDRPLSVVKELLENSLDAAADSITIEIKKGGKSYIRVTDNGCGIPPDEVQLAFERHATGKITSAADLDAIKTLGFRGEALASIAAVSRTQIITKTAENKTGTQLTVEGGKTAANKATGCPDGTTVVVSDLFYNVPARLKFLKSDAAESGRIIDFVSRMAIAYDDVKIRLISNDNILFSTRGNGNRYENIVNVYSSDTGSKLIPISREEGYLQISGYISNPSQSRNSRRGQVFFVNGRAVSSKVIEKGLNEAYADRLLSGRHPSAYIFLTAAPDKLDVNIHPNKLEIRFDDEKAVSDFVRDAVSDTLAAGEAVPEITDRQINTFAKKKTEQIPEAVESQQEADDEAKKEQEKQPEKRSEEQVDINKILSIYSGEQKTLSEEGPKYDAADQAPSAPPKPFDFNQLTLTGSIFNTYITAVDEDSFYLVDQHAAHERIFYERLMEQYENAEKSQQTIITPLVFDVDAETGESEAGWFSELEKMGFDIAEFGQRTYIIKAVPMFMELDEAENFVDDFLDNFCESNFVEKNSDQNSDFRNERAVRRIISRSCKSAVKANDRLTHTEAAKLLDDLKMCKNPFSCPHGRPTFIKMTRYEIEKMFKRT